MTAIAPLHRAPAGRGRPAAGPLRQPPSAPEVPDPPSAPEVPDIGRLYREFSGQLEMLVRGDVRACDALIEDACHLAWTQLLRYHHRVAPEGVTVWLIRTAVREAVRLLRRYTRECSLEVLLDDDEDGADFSATIQREDVLAQRERLLDVQHLPRRQQRIVWLKALGFSYEEVASQECCTLRTVDRQLCQARQRLHALESAAA